MKFLNLLLFLFLIQTGAWAQKPKVVRTSLNHGGSSQSIQWDDRSFIVQQSIGQSGVIGSLGNPMAVLNQGFIQPLTRAGQPVVQTGLKAVIYPNPFSSRVRIVFEEHVDQKMLATIFDLAGKILYEDEGFVTNHWALDLTALPQGQYLIRIESPNRHFISQLIKL